MSFTASEQTPEGVQDQQAAPDPTPAATPPAPAAPTPVSSQGPWSSDLAQVFEDEAVRGQVDSFLREKVQPYTTRLEQQARVNEQATNLWQNFETDPINTYVQVTHELLGEELANEFLEFAQNRLNGQQQEPAPTPTPEVPQNMTLTPEQQAAIEWSQQQQVKEYYGQQLAELKAKPENKDLVDLKDAKGNSVIEHIHPWVQVAGGDFDQAAQLLRGFVQEYGVPQSAMPEIPTPPAPNVFGSDTATAQPSNTPVEQPKQTINEAIDSWMVEQREARSAPPMGAV